MAMPDTSLQGARGSSDHLQLRQLQSCAHGLLCVVLVGLWVTQVDEHPVAHVLGYKTAEAMHVSATHF